MIKDDVGGRARIMAGEEWVLGLWRYE